MRDDPQLTIIFALIVFGIMFIAHTVSDYNLIANTPDFCQKIKAEKHFGVIK